ncbi:Nuclear factor related to kappa-B-binding protein [Camellia lanceoleosa]|uniref:Nuclear factor related to kappa-B-binding protein n=1 Tax=Camellia lanceoleosa TaxID=1840588 RepID=A0ACC0GH18_9ERIC|nr:Nuclear factor related to kappa-B-binding protein [Camellia lanceoleosa]
MAADQRKKRLTTASVTSFQEKGREKRKKFGLLQCDLNVRSNISLKWDDKRKSVVAKREQISLKKGDLIPFIDYVPHCHNILADVLVVPHEIFELDNLKEVLSYEVWKTHLSENERNYLMQFLPMGAEMYQVVQELSVGDYFHFGNPFIKWGDSLCSGNLHPDAVLHQEQCFKTSKKSYYSELKKYHKGYVILMSYLFFLLCIVHCVLNCFFALNWMVTIVYAFCCSMVGNLLTWKEKWASCKDPEKEIVRKIWRSRKQVERNMSTDANEYRFHDAEDNFAAMSESGSWATDEKAGSSSDDQNLMRKHGELQTRPRKEKNLHKQNMQCGDGSKYMSYIKVSKEKHQRLRSSMKNSSNSIQSRSLNHVLGNLDTFHVQPFEVFEKEERKKLHEHWLQLVNRDLPVAFANWRTWQIKKWQMVQSLDREMEENLKSVKEDEEKETALNMLLDLTDNRAADFEATITVEVEEKGTSDSLIQEQIDDGAENHNPDIALEDVQGLTDNEAAKHVPTIEDDNESLPVSTQNQHLQPIPSLNGRHEFSPMDLDSDNNVNVETDDIPHNVSESAENLNHVDIAVSQGDPLSSTKQLARRIDLESDNQEDGTEKALLHRQPIERPCFNPDKEVQDRNELLQHFFKAQDGLPYRHEQKQKGLDFFARSGLRAC